MTAPVRRNAQALKPCRFQGCDETPCSSGVCRQHYRHGIYRIHQNKSQRASMWRAYRDPLKRLRRKWSGLKTSVKGFAGDEHWSLQSNYMYQHLQLCTEVYFFDFTLNHSPYLALCETWLNSSCDLKLAPTLIRLEPHRGFVEGNLKWVTRSEAAMIQRSQRYVNKGVPNEISKW